jgi:hypothetical protein
MSCCDKEEEEKGVTAFMPGVKCYKNIFLRR